jgi:solute carrier family 25 (mitochondrial carnitine/acylcarnitine transporter), member 20/29
MRLWPIPFALILFPIVAPSQLLWSSPKSSTFTLVDALSADPDYTSLLRLLQRARLIPTLNKLNGSTLFAPTNDAIKRHLSRNPFWASLLQQDHLDNVQEQLRQQLFYHLFNYNYSLPTDQDIQTHRTLLFPHTPLQPPSQNPPPSPPWMPTPGGSLGGEPQRLRVVARDEAAWVGVDAFGKGGSQIIKAQTEARNGILFGIADVLDPPPDLG